MVGGMGIGVVELSGRLVVDNFVDKLGRLGIGWSVPDQR